MLIEKNVTLDSGEVYYWGAGLGVFKNHSIEYGSDNGWYGTKCGVKNQWMVETWKYASLRYGTYVKFSWVFNGQQVVHFENVRMIISTLFADCLGSIDCACLKNKQSERYCKIQVDTKLLKGALIITIILKSNNGF